MMRKNKDITTKNNRKLYVGTVKKFRRGFAFVIPDKNQEYEENSKYTVLESDIFIPPERLHGAMDGDKVAVDLIPEYLWDNSPEGIIVRILNRAITEVVGTFQKQNHKNKKFGFVIPEGKSFVEDVYIKNQNSSGAKTGDKVVAQILKYPDRNSKAEGRIAEIICKKGKPGGDVKALIRSYGYRDTFPSRAAAQAKAISKLIIPDEEVRRRRDLRNQIVFTIDGPDSKDFDDAVSIKKLENGNFLLGVHIADVSTFVQAGDYLDREAAKRGNSVYVLDKVVPMLPEELSAGICSLKPYEDRLTLSVDMEVTESGAVVNHEIYESVINSNARLVYGDVSDYIEKNDGGAPVKLEIEHSEICPCIEVMASLAEILRKKRFSEGSIDFDIDEASIILDESGRAREIAIAERRTANRLIEEFMLLANKTVAEHIYWMDVPFIYRVHGKPDHEKLEELKVFLKGIGMSVKGSSDNMHPRELNNILEQARGSDRENVITETVLRTMQKAKYETDCEGHFGLAFKYYCHFTSPIRRYPDLFIHRVIKEILEAEYKGYDSEKMKQYEASAVVAADHSSETERKAIELEREAEKMKMAEYMANHIGESFRGIISGVTNFGIYVQLENLVEGLVRYDSMTDDFYDFDKRLFSAVGERTGKKYSFGDEIQVIVAASNPERREIDFEIDRWSRH